MNCNLQTYLTEVHLTQIQILFPLWEYAVQESACKESKKLRSGMNYNLQTYKSTSDADRGPLELKRSSCRAFPCGVRFAGICSTLRSGRNQESSAEYRRWEIL